MPFEELETIRRDNLPPMASLSYLRKVRKDKEFDRGKIKPQLTISVPSVIFISKKERFQLLLGTGQDANKLRIRATADQKKGTKLSEFKTYFILRFGYVPKLGDEIFDNIRCDIKRINDDEYDVIVPAELNLSSVAVSLLRDKVKSA